jgi:WD40 repeat protein
VIHRDIKPSNVMVTLHDGDAVPKVIDFGIAKATNQKLTEKTLFTNYSHMIGTPAYMSPEQAEMSGLDVDTRTDVYSLGVLLYELLTGRTPFCGKELMSGGYAEMQRIIAEQEPPKPSRVLSSMHDAESTILATNRSIDIGALNKVFQGDLDWIVMKSLEKDRSRRYDTANGLAADIKRFQNNEPVIARPPSAFYKFHKAWRRNKVVYTSGAVVLAALLIGVTVSIIGLNRAVKAEQKALKNQNTALVNADKAKAASEEVTLAYQQVSDQAEELRKHFYDQSIALAYRELGANRPAHVRNLLDECPEDLRGWEWDYLRHESMDGYYPVTRLSNPVYSMIASPDGMNIALLNGQTLQLAAISPSGNLDTKATLGTMPPAFFDITPWISFSKDSRWLAAVTENSQINIWDVEKGKLAHLFPSGADPVDVVAFSSKEDQVAIVRSKAYGSSVATIDFYEVPTGMPIRKIEVNASVFNLAFSPDGRYMAAGVVTSRPPHFVRIYDPQTGKPITELYQHLTPICGLAFSPDNRWLATSGDTTIKLWDLSDGSLRTTLEGHSSSITSLEWINDPGHYRLVSGGLDRELKIWDPFGPSQLLSLNGHRNGISSIAVAPAGRLISSDFSGEVHVRDTTSVMETKEVLDLNAHTNRIYQLTFHPEKPNRLYSTGEDGGFVWDTHGGVVLDRFPSLFDVSISRDGQHIVHPGAHKPEDLTWDEWTDAGITLEINNALSVDQFETEQNPDNKIYFSSDISVDNQWIAGGSFDGTVHLWRKGSDMSRVILKGHRHYVTMVRFSGDGRYLVSLAGNGEILRWDAQRISEPQDPFRLMAPNAMRDIAQFGISKDGQRLVTGDGYGDILMYQLESGTELLRIQDAHSGIIVSAKLSPDGKWIASGGSDHVVRLWDAEAGSLLQKFLGHNSVVNTVAFSPDCKQLASGGWDQVIKIWDINTD